MANHRNTGTEWLDQLEGADYRWDDRPPPAPEAEIAALAHFVGRPLPSDYVAFLRRHNGGALYYCDLWFLRLWRAADIPAWSAAYGFTPHTIPGAIAIGSDAGSEGIVLDVRPEQADGAYPIYAINFVGVSWKDAIAVAPDFRSLLQLRQRLLAKE